MNLRLVFVSLLLSVFYCVPSFGQYYGMENTSPQNWTIGLSGGAGYLLGDVMTDLPGYQGGGYLQKNVSRVLNFRIQYHYGNNSGLNLTPSRDFRFNSALNGLQDSVHFYDSTQQVFHNYKMNYQELSFLFKLNLNRMFVSEGAENWDLYALAGVGIFLYQTRIDVYDDTEGTVYSYDNISLDDPITTELDLKEMLDGNYETPGQQDLLNSARIGAWTRKTSFVLGGGIRIKLSEVVALGLEGRMMFISDDLLDGQQWTEENLQSPDNDRIVNAGLTLDFSF